MAVELFVEPELAELDEIQNASEWFEIASELGLENQLKFASKEEHKKPAPYMYVDPKTSAIIKAICPVQVNYKEYKASTIPLDILKEIKKAEDSGWYEAIHICYDDKSPDPFVIGITKAENNWSRHVHLIGRWGPELLPFEQLEEKAIERRTYEVTQMLEQTKNQVEYALKDVKSFIKANLGQEMRINGSVDAERLRSWI